MTKRWKNGRWLRGGRLKPFVDNVIVPSPFGPNATIGDALRMVLPQIDALRSSAHVAMCAASRSGLNASAADEEGQTC